MSVDHDFDPIELPEAPPSVAAREQAIFKAVTQFEQNQRQRGRTMPQPRRLSLGALLPRPGLRLALATGAAVLIAVPMGVETIKRLPLNTVVDQQPTQAPQPPLPQAGASLGQDRAERLAARAVPKPQSQLEARSDQPQNAGSSAPVRSAPSEPEQVAHVTAPPALPMAPAPVPAAPSRPASVAANSGTSSEAGGNLPVNKNEVVAYMKACSAFGPGFIFMPGSGACLRVEGEIRADYRALPSVDAGPVARGGTYASAPVGNRALGGARMADARPSTIQVGGGLSATLSIEDGRAAPPAAKRNVWFDARAQTDYGLLRRSFPTDAAGSAAAPAVSVAANVPAASPVGIINAPPPPPKAEIGRDKFANAPENPFKAVAQEPVSTFSIDVDTASYSYVRAALNQNVLPQPDAVRTEEMINYFPYDYAPPKSAAEPFSTAVTVMPNPWVAGHKLLRIGIQGYALPAQERPPANLVFLIDTSGSMDEPNKLPLLVKSLGMLVDTLRPEDRVSIVSYAGAAGLVLPPTKASDKATIEAALDRLSAGGSTAGGEGLRLAYQLAEANFDPKAVNRVMLSTDGDFNVGITDPNELKGFVARERDKGILLSVLGFGMGNLNDAMMQALAQNGNGVAAYIDTLNEARKVLVDQATSTLFPIATDVKIQVEFNPAAVSDYRLVGYETRMLKTEDFNNDKVDAGDVGSGASVTAIYDFVPSGGPRPVDASRYQPQAAPAAGKSDEYAFLKIRYKLPKSDKSTLMTTPVTHAGEAESLAQAPADARFAVAVAGFGEWLRGGTYTGSLTPDDIIALANGAKGEDPFGYRAEFVNLVRAAKLAKGLPSSAQ